MCLKYELEVNLHQIIINLILSLGLLHQVQDIRLQAGSGSGSGSSGKTGNGGNGNGESAGRGCTRGRRDRADEWVRRTRPDEIQSKVFLLF